MTLNTSRHQLYACLLAYTGMRIEEILGLKWVRVNLEDGYCIVQEAVTCQRMYRETFRELGIYGKYTNHDLRSSYATWLKERGVEISSAADLMGHKDTRMISRMYAPPDIRASSPTRL